MRLSENGLTLAGESTNVTTRRYYHARRSVARVSGGAVYMREIRNIIVSRICAAFWSSFNKLKRRVKKWIYHLSR